MVQKRETKAINKLCVREILSLSFVCGAYFFEFRGRNLVCFVMAYNSNGKYAPEAGKTCMRTAFFTRAQCRSTLSSCSIIRCSSYLPLFAVVYCDGQPTEKYSKCHKPCFHSLSQA